MSRIIFITGTDTGVGKTTLTCLLLRYLRDSGVRALAMKPFCSGGKADLAAIRAIQGNELAPKLLNPFYFRQPLAPAVAAHGAGETVSIRAALNAIRKAASRCDCLLVEGAGGVLVPLTRRFTIADLVQQLNCDVLVVSRNKLGTINHTLMTLEVLRSRNIRRLKLIFFEQVVRDISSQSNVTWLAKITGNIGVFVLPWKKNQACRWSQNFPGTKKIKKTLAQICDPDSFCPVVRTAENKQRNERLKNEK